MLIHIGYHKTGTSWLQQEFFCNNYGFNNLLTHEEVDRYINKVRFLNFSPEELLRVTNLRKDTRTTNVISSEILSGSPLSGGAQSYENLLKLKAAFPDAKVLIVVRNQSDFLKSIYLQYIKTGGVLKLADFMTFLNRSPSHIGWDLQHVLYSGLVDAYNTCFGEDNVLVYQYEFMQNKDDFIQRLCDFLRRPVFSLDDQSERKVNLSLTYPVARVIRCVNHLYRSFNNPTGFIPQAWYYRRIIEISKFIGEHFSISSDFDVPWSEENRVAIARDNAKLQKLIGSLHPTYEL